MKKLSALLLVLFIFSISIADAKTRARNRLSSAGGIVSPSATSALGENPAGLAYNDEAKVNVAGTKGFGRTLGYAGGFFYGEDGTAGAINLSGFNSHTGSPGNVLLLNYGLGLMLGSKVAFGFTGTTTLLEKGEVSGTGTSTTWCADTGIIINPNGRTRFGIAVFQLLADVEAVGVGWARKLGQHALFAIDGVFTKPSSNFLVKPSIKLYWSFFQMEVSYGQKVAGGGWSWISSGPTAGVGFKLGRHFHITGYINHIARGYVGLDIIM